MYRCPKCKQPLVSEIDIMQGIENTIGYFIDISLRIATSGSFRMPYFCCVNKRCKYYVHKNILRPFYLRVNILGRVVPVQFTL